MLQNAEQNAKSVAKCNSQNGNARMAYVVNLVFSRVCDYQNIFLVWHDDCRYILAQERDGEE
jgi:hypothetical protein